MDPRIPVDEAALRAVEEERRRRTGDNVEAGLDGAVDIVDLTLDGALAVVADGAVAVAEGAVNLVGAVIGGLLEG